MIPRKSEKNNIAEKCAHGFLLIHFAVILRGCQKRAFRSKICLDFMTFCGLESNWVSFPVDNLSIFNVV